MSSTLLFLRTRINLLALLICGACSGCWMVILAKRYYFYAPDAVTWDLAYFDQILWGMRHGSLSPSIINANFLTDHCFFISFLFAPLYWLYPDPMLPPYLLIIAFFCGAYTLFLILKKYLNPWIALGAMLAFIIAPANISLLLSRFNYEPFAIPLIFLIFKAMDDDNFKVYITCCLLLAMVKEQMPLAVMMFGVLALFSKKDKIKWGWVPVAIGISIFIAEVFILTPYLRRHLPLNSGYHWLLYKNFGKTPQEIFLFLLSHPLTVMQQFILPGNIKWYNDLFGVWGSLAFLSPHILLPASLLFIKTILSSNPQEHDPLRQFYYASTYTPFIFLAAWNTLNHIHGRWRTPIHILALAIMFMHALMLLSPRLAAMNPGITHKSLARQKLVDQIPDHASVLSAWTTLSPLANRQELYPIYSYLTGSYLTSLKKFKWPQGLDYILLDFDDEQMSNVTPKKYASKMAALNFNSHWRLQESIEGMALYIRNSPGQQPWRLVEKSSQPFGPHKGNLKEFDNALRLNGLDFPVFFPSRYNIFPIIMYWQCLTDTPASYKILLKVIAADGATVYTNSKPIGSAIYPTYFWKQGMYVRESYFCLLPSLPQGHYFIRISVNNKNTKKWVGTVTESFSVSDAVK